MDVGNMTDFGREFCLKKYIHMVIILQNRQRL